MISYSARLVVICQFFKKCNAFSHFLRPFWIFAGHLGHKLYLLMNVSSITLSGQKRYTQTKLGSQNEHSQTWYINHMNIPGLGPVAIG